ncbi:PAS domain-containing protein [Pontibacter sp. H249]|uniref:PAS domain-containing protein n=1 Tax=Pontibacter sp. H249 TaxID=3133420 RepID=UPI0030BE626A
MDYQKLFVSVPEAIVLLSPDFTILAANDRYLEVTMRTHDELIGKDFLKTFPDNPDASESKNEMLLRQSLENTLRTKHVDYLDVLRYDIPRPASQGGGFDVRYWEASHTPILDDEGNVECLMQLTKDVTEREVAKLELSETQEKFKFMAEAMPLLIFTTNTEGKITYLNQRWGKYTGTATKELIYNGVKQVFHPEDAATFTTRWADAFANNTELQMEVRVKASEGIYRWHLARILPQVDESGKLLMWVGAITDIHNSKQLVEELLEANTQMEQLSNHVQQAFKKVESERNILERLIIESPAFFCILKGPEHTFELINKNYQKIFPGKELLHKPVAKALPEVVDQGYIAILDKVYQTGESYVAEHIRIMLDRYNTGALEELTISFQYQPLYDENNTIYGILVFGYEIPALSHQQ